jgi:hypothetical protein
MTQVTNSGFQSIVNSQPAPGQAGDFYGVNIRAVVLGSNIPYGTPGAGGQGAVGQLVSPPGGLTVGNFAWADLNTGAVSQGFDPNGQLGFLHREEQAIIVTYLGISTYVVNQGFPITLFSQGSFWAKFAGGASPGQKVYADPATGAPIAANTTPVADSLTGSIGFSGTGTLVTATPNLTIASVVSGILSIGDTVTGTDIPANTTILSQTSGTPGGVGVYVMSANASGTVSSAEAITSTSTVLDATAVASGTLGAGDVLSGSGITTGTQITGQLSGTPGGVGTYRISVAQGPIAGEAVTSNAILTNFIVKRTCGAGEVAVISSWGT